MTMVYRVTRLPDRVECDWSGSGKFIMGWSRNRVHFHPRIYRLAFNGVDSAPASELDSRLSAVFSEGLAELLEQDALLLRVTLPHDDLLVGPLRRLGFLTARGVYSVAMEVADIMGQRSPASLDESMRVLSLRAALASVPASNIADTWTEIYARTARLDPATPEALSIDEQHELFLGDTDLDLDLSICLFKDEKPIGICAVHRSDDARQLELGSTGVVAESLPKFQELSLALVGEVAFQAAPQGVERLVAEVDSDAPWGLYAFADLPCTVIEDLVSLMYVPRWNGHR